MKRKKEMKKILAEIQSGAFAQEFMGGNKEGLSRLKELREKESQHPIEKVGAQLRAMMPWIGKNKLLSLIVTFGAQSLLPLSNATVLLYMSTLLTPAFAYIFLKERVGAHRWAAIIVGMSGVLVIAAPSSQISAIGLLLALFAATLHASMYTMLRHLKAESAITVTFYFVLAGMILPGLCMPWFAKGIAWEEAWLFLLVGASGGFAQLCLTNAYKYAPAAVITPFAYTSLLWSTLMDSMIWNNPPGGSIFTGASIIIAAQLYILYREHVNRQKTSHLKSEIP
jgi:drug/metabolite transporter (DMT)-like permease